VSASAVLALGLSVVSTGGGCGSSSDTAKSVTVKPGQSIQAAVDAAAPGETINVMPGDYTEQGTASDFGLVAVRITKPLNLIAKSAPPPGKKVRILPGPGQMHGILVEPANEGDPDIDGLEINGFTVQGFSNMGIWLRHVNNFDIENNESIDNLENGIFPTLSANGLVKKNLAYGSQDSALWVEASENVRVLSNELHDSPTGLEITISKEITAEKNNIHDNTIGVGLYPPSTAGLPQDEWPSFFDDGHWHVLNNDVHDNNTENSASEGSETSQLPLGVGVLVMGVHDIDLQMNQVEHNVFIGIGLADYCLVVAGTPFNCTDNPPPANPASERVQVIKNTLVNNHGAPPPGPFQAFAADILEVQADPNAATTNCFSKNTINNPPPNPPFTIPDPLVPVCN
jgi:parallel beta-helix repeat protein